MKTDFQPNEVLMAGDLNANFQECAGKADAEHTHTIENVTGLQNALDGKASTDITDFQQQVIDELRESKADVNHTQEISTITGLQAALDGKADKQGFEATKTSLNPITITGLDNITTPGVYFGSVYEDDNEIGAVLIVSNGLQGESYYQTLITGVWGHSTSDIEYYTRNNGGHWSAWVKKTIKAV